VEDTPLVIAGKTYKSRLILGTGKYKSFELMKEALIAADPAMVTVAVRRVNLSDKSSQSFWNYLPAGLPILPNTAGCYTADDALRTARLAREALETNLIKIEVIGDPKTLFPDVEATLQATRILVKEGFTVLPYTSDDPIVAKRLEEAGAATIMPLASPIGSGQGILNPLPVRFILEQAKVPVIVDAGVGTASDAAQAMELGAAGVLMNTAVAEAQNPVTMAQAMRLGVEAGRLAYLAGRMPKKYSGSASSPTAGLVTPVGLSGS
jgi:thiazole synthase